MQPIFLILPIIAAFISILATASALSAIETEHILDRVKRQDTDEDLERELCKDKHAGEWFRLETGKDKCRDVIQCTASGLQAIRCPSGLAFDIEKQTCDWKASVENCEMIKKENKVKPLLSTDEPMCNENHLACGDGNCLEKSVFCDGKEDCNDGSDENACDIDTDPNRAPKCDPVICNLPDCFCSEDGIQVPGNLCTVGPQQSNCSNVPQMITISFDDAINNNNIDLYEEIFNGRRLNPNGCTIKGTFFVSHKYTNYTAVSQLHQKGHEVAAHSITHRNEKFWSSASTDDWAKEMAGSRLIIEKFADIIDNSVVGLRAPFLRVGGNNQFTMMEEQAFLYDSSITAPLQQIPLWPYTMYFRMPHSCHGDLQNCPTRSHAVWEMVMNELDRREDPTSGDDLPGCAMIDSCSNIKEAIQFYNFLVHNFDRHYNSNRAPLGLFFHAAWLKNQPEFLDAFMYWIEEVLAKHSDVYFLPMTKVIQWMQDPKQSHEAKTFAPWLEKCNPHPEPCLTPFNCRLSTNELPGEALHMAACSRCPNKYPWIDDPTGDGFV